MPFYSQYSLRLIKPSTQLNSQRKISQNSEITITSKEFINEHENPKSSLTNQRYFDSTQIEKRTEEILCNLNHLNNIKK